jgi:hypothetical protein
MLKSVEVISLYWNMLPIQDVMCLSSLDVVGCRCVRTGLPELSFYSDGNLAITSASSLGKEEGRKPVLPITQVNYTLQSYPVR